MYMHTYIDQEYTYNIYIYIRISFSLSVSLYHVLSVSLSLSDQNVCMVRVALSGFMGRVWFQKSQRLSLFVMVHDMGGASINGDPKHKP